MSSHSSSSSSTTLSSSSSSSSSSYILPDAFYLDDPQDGISAYLLSTLQVTLHRHLHTLEHAKSVAQEHVTKGGPCEVFTATEDLWEAETTSLVPMVYYVTNGGVFLDVRDSADAWIRIILRTGDAITIPSTLARRIVRPTGSGAPYVTPVYPDNPDRSSRMTTIVRGANVAPVPHAGTLHILTLPGKGGDGMKLPYPASTLHRKYIPNSLEEIEANRPHYTKPGIAHTRDIVVDLCSSFYTLGWVTGTGGSISIRHGDRIFMAPSGVQKERMQRQDIFVLDTAGKEIYYPEPLPLKPRLKLSQCAPLFHHAFTLRHAGACIHTHDINAVMVTLLAGNETEFRITHQEMIKGIAGHGFLDTCVVPIIENTPHECDLADSLGEAMRAYPRSNAVLVRRHGVYVWGDSWEAAKTQAECYHYLFEAAVRMRQIGIDPAMVPSRNTHGIGAQRAYGSGNENSGGYGSQRTHITTTTMMASSGGTKRPLENDSSHSSSSSLSSSNDACCNGNDHHHHHHMEQPSSKRSTHHTEATGSGFHGNTGTNTMEVDTTSLQGNSTVIPCLSDYSCVLLDIEGCTTSIQFVMDTLFPYAAQKVKQYLTSTWTTAETMQDVQALIHQSTVDVQQKVDGAAQVHLTTERHGTSTVNSQIIDEVCANIAWQMAANRKTTGLKQLQGHIWRYGYEKNELHGHIFDDTLVALQEWTQQYHKSCYIYSSGSREAQRLLFQYSIKGDLRKYLSGYFDTKVGPKIESSSYKDIALSLGLDNAPHRILFATDSLAEAKAAKEAGLTVVVTDRPGNTPLPPNGVPFPVVTSLATLSSAK